MPLASSSKGCRSTSGLLAHSRTNLASRIVQLLIFAPIAIAILSRGGRLTDRRRTPFKTKEAIEYKAIVLKSSRRITGSIIFDHNCCPCLTGPDGRGEHLNAEHSAQPYRDGSSASSFDGMRR